MMDLLDALRLRPSSTEPLRSDPIQPEHLKLLVESAARSPSHFNSQPWRFVIVRDLDMRRRIGTIAADPSLSDAAALLFIALDRGEYRIGELQGLYTLITFGAVVQSFWLTAHAIHLGLVMVKPPLDDSTVRAAIAGELHVPDTHELVALFRMGYYQSAVTPTERDSTPPPFESLVYGDRWGRAAPVAVRNASSLLWDATPPKK